MVDRTAGRYDFRFDPKFGGCTGIVHRNYFFLGVAFHPATSKLARPSGTMSREDDFRSPFKNSSNRHWVSEWHGSRYREDAMAAVVPGIASAPAPPAKRRAWEDGAIGRLEHGTLLAMPLTE